MSDVLHRSHLNTAHNEPSQARLAAEHAFLAASSTGEADGGPVIVVRRKKTVVAASEGHDSTTERLELTRESRTPKVYRVEHGPDSAPSDDLEESDEVATSFTGSHTEAIVQRVVPIKRRRRVIRHGEVTIIRPQPSDGEGERVLTAAEESTAPTAELVSPGKLTQEFTALKRRALADLAAIQSEIRQLERQAEAVRKVEAARAVRWIRKAITEYGLGCDDLGL